MAGITSGGGRSPSSREASQAMIDREERAAYNDAAVAASGAGSPSAGVGGMNPLARQKYEGEMAVKRRRKMRDADITPEQEQALTNAMEHSGSKSMWAGNYGPGFQNYRARAAMDDLAMRRTRKGGDPEAEIDPSKWSLPEHFRI